MKRIFVSILSGIFWLFASIVVIVLSLALLAMFAIGMALLFGGKLG